MKEELSKQVLVLSINSLHPATLRGCAIFYEKFPDLPRRRGQTGLSPSHYQDISTIPDLTRRRVKTGLSINDINYGGEE